MGVLSASAVSSAVALVWAKMVAWVEARASGFAPALSVVPQGPASAVAAAVGVAGVASRLVVDP